MIAWQHLYPRTLYVEGNYQENLRKLFEYMEEKNITGILTKFNNIWKKNLKTFQITFFKKMKALWIYFLLQLTLNFIDDDSLNHIFNAFTKTLRSDTPYLSYKAAVKEFISKFWKTCRLLFVYIYSLH